MTIASSVPTQVCVNLSCLGLWWHLCCRQATNSFAHAIHTHRKMQQYSLLELFLKVTDVQTLMLKLLPSITPASLDICCPSEMKFACFCFLPTLSVNELSKMCSLDIFLGKVHLCFLPGISLEAWMSICAFENWHQDTTEQSRLLQ